MKSLAVFEIDGVLDISQRAVAVAKQALRSDEWEIAFVTARTRERTNETLAFLAERLKANKVPKTAATYCCGESTAIATSNKKITTFQSLIRQHHGIERVVCYDNDDFVLNGNFMFLRSRNTPRSYSLYRVVDAQPVAVYGSAVYTKQGPSEF